MGEVTKHAPQRAIKNVGRAIANFFDDLKKYRRGNRAAAKTKLARLHRRIADIRTDVLHKLTTSLMRYRTIVIEDLNVPVGKSSSIARNRRPWVLRVPTTT